ncbi:MAG: FecR domain-containing protein [Opitutae bacterium]|nr:FecR domain-containing protein [Opitutae bacterium]
MKHSDPAPENSPDVARAAAEWVLRLDRGLTPAEQDAYTQWLAADSRHREALAEHRWGWDEFDRLAGIQDSVHARPDPDLLAPPPPVRGRRLRFLPHVVTLAAAAAVAVVFWWPPASGTREPSVPAPSYALAAPIEERLLEDGSVVALNRGAVLETAFTAAERRVRLLRGEANFTVAKNPARPFIVNAGGVDVRAVGTVFNVRLGHAEVEVVVTEGKVGVQRPSDSAVASAEAQPAPTYLVANERAVVQLGGLAGPALVSKLGPTELDRRLAWQPRLLDFTDQPLEEIVAEFNRRNSVRLVLADPTLESLRLTASFRSDNVEGFVRLMESDFGMQAEWRGEMEIALRRK